MVFKQYVNLIFSYIAKDSINKVHVREKNTYKLIQPTHYADFIQKYPIVLFLKTNETVQTAFEQRYACITANDLEICNVSMK